MGEGPLYGCWPRLLNGTSTFRSSKPVKPSSSLEMNCTEPSVAFHAPQSAGSCDNLSRPAQSIPARDFLWCSPCEEHVSGNSDVPTRVALDMAHPKPPMRGTYPSPPLNKHSTRPRPAVTAFTREPDT